MLPLVPAPVDPTLDSLVPKPVSVRPGPGSFAVGAETRIVASGAAKGAGDALARSWNLHRAGSAKRAILIRVDAGSGMKPEGYRLSVTPERIEIRGADAAGAFYGVQTLRQLLPAASFDRPGGRSIPAVEIEDAPRFGWRGLHLDCARHFFTKDEVKSYLDAMAFHKLNTFHWHLTDDQGWRLEIKRYPKLTSVGAWRKDTMLTYSPATFEGKPHGGFYTQKDVREVVAYAAARHVTVVPEIEMPGHAQAAIAAYPELGNTGKKIEVGTSWGVITDVFNAEDSTLTFLQNVLAEVLRLFPSRFIHVGGDEVPKDQWKASPAAQAKMKALGLKDEHELQSYFIRTMDAWLAARGRRLIGWDEILEGGLAPGATVMSWRGIDGGVAAAKAGHDVVMAANSHLYLDYYQSKDTKREPRAIGGFLPLERVYSFDPIPPALTAAEGRHVLGLQGQIWTEYIPTFAQVEYMAFPRACAVAEIGWSPKEGRSFEEFKVRLATHLERLRAMGVAFRPLD